ncbi:hypothetical protein [Dehalococcoides sp.]|jgi:hypothetical protein|uniref:hypothetical protein n=1 Tax=Dehalococcoides sp. TaxID=1966486 RepID=UPI003561CE53
MKEFMFYLSATMTLVGFTVGFYGGISIFTGACLTRKPETEKVAARLMLWCLVPTVLGTVGMLVFV